MIAPELFDTIELLVDIPERQLYAGMLGAIVDQYDDEHFEVEFANDAGKTEQLCTLSSDQFIVVWQNATKAPVTTADLITQLTLRLDEAKQQEVAQYARALYAHHSLHFS